MIVCFNGKNVVLGILVFYVIVWVIGINVVLRIYNILCYCLKLYVDSLFIREILELFM